MTKSKKLHEVHFTKATKDGDVGRTTIRKFKTRIGAQNHFNRCIKRADLFGCSWWFGRHELASCNGM
jgi:hypothetical protein